MTEEMKELDFFFVNQTIKLFFFFGFYFVFFFRTLKASFSHSIQFLWNQESTLDIFNLMKLSGIYFLIPCFVVLFLFFLEGWGWGVGGGWVSCMLLLHIWNNWDTVISRVLTCLYLVLIRMLIFASCTC